ncbi:hypothetical protein K505DRAFT_248287 [Melanomma pulvis-pyrius CBS 109.77]|uniref:Helicase ATP-binding domain-containing protein n=1 Tax=Melanomma pulvis-pyrius CBS 109.77 TaxID=1314802 RepID=A0A6A6X659_9PLEO|nr:hypothetical protein K505DRAFT_248287 [Melanomma pulvis-pyrius CBS 109.77]
MTLPRPILIRTTLHKHQKQALAFMLRRETGWSFDGKEPDVWKASNTDQGRIYTNRISHTHYTEAPPQFYGGILADSVGFGKTLTMIALAASDLGTNQAMNDCIATGGDSKPCVKATLIVVPQPLLVSWEEQLLEHVIDGGLRFYTHHGKTRINELSDLDAINIVLTTYPTIKGDWVATPNHIIFSIRWKRVILDDAHLVIRNLKSTMARSIFSLDSVSRWAVIGTPIQNRLTDLAGLFKFIKVYPYDDPKYLEGDITHLFRSGEEEEAVKRLEYLSSCVMVRRGQLAIDHPSRSTIDCPVEFSKAEKRVYETMRQHTLANLDDALLHESDLSTSDVYVTSLQQIVSMRRMCNLGLHYNTPSNWVSASDWKIVAQEIFNFQCKLQPLACSQCSFTYDLSGTIINDPNIQFPPFFSRCLKYACSHCSFELNKSGVQMICGHTPPCPTASVPFGLSLFGQRPSHGSYQIEKTSIPFPSKVKVLVADVKTLPLDVKCIVFSNWDQSLNIVKDGLAQAGICSIHLDRASTMSLSQRQHILAQFKSDPSIRVMLLNMSFYTSRLNLTAASRVYIMEPHWQDRLPNLPTLALIHHIGQTRNVTTVRLYVRDTLEERLLKIDHQKQKVNSAKWLLSAHDGRLDDKVGNLQTLRSLLS